MERKRFHLIKSGLRLRLTEVGQGCSLQVHTSWGSSAASRVAMKSQLSCNLLRAPTKPLSPWPRLRCPNLAPQSQMPSQAQVNAAISAISARCCVARNHAAYQCCAGSARVSGPLVLLQPASGVAQHKPSSAGSSSQVGMHWRAVWLMLAQSGSGGSCLLPCLLVHRALLRELVSSRHN